MEKNIKTKDIQSFLRLNTNSEQHSQENMYIYILRMILILYNQVVNNTEKQKMIFNFLTNSSHIIIFKGNVNNIHSPV